MDAVLELLSSVQVSTSFSRQSSKYLATASVLFCIAYDQHQWVGAIYQVSSSNHGHSSQVTATMGQYLFFSTIPLIVVRLSAKAIEYTTCTISQRIDRWIPNTELTGIVSIAVVGVLMMMASERRNRGGIVRISSED